MGFNDESFYVKKYISATNRILEEKATEKEKIEKRIERIQKIFSEKGKIKENTFFFEHGNLIYSFQKELIDDSEKERLSFLNLSFKDLQDVYQMSSFSLENENSQYDPFGSFTGKVLLFGENVKQEILESMKAALAYPERGEPIILLSLKEMYSFIGIIEFLHELGHYFDDKRKEESEFKKDQGDYGEAIFLLKNGMGSFGEISIVLKSERNAWAYTLKKIRPFLKDFQLKNEDILFFTHFSLKDGYINFFENIIHPHFVEKVKEKRKEFVKSVIEMSHKDYFMFLTVYTILSLWEKRYPRQREGKNLLEDENFVSFFISHFPFSKI